MRLSKNGFRSIVLAVLLLLMMFSVEAKLFMAHGSQTATGVKLSSFTAREWEGKILLEWRTGYEVNNLGFHVYREEGEEVHRLTPDLVAGSSLLTASGTGASAGRRYSWWDITAVSPARAGSAVSLRYWLEDIDLNGTRTLHGPIQVEASDVGGRSRQGGIGGQTLGFDQKQSSLLSDLGTRLEEKHRDFWRVQEFKEGLAQKRLEAKGARGSRSVVLEEKASTPAGTPLKASRAATQRDFVPDPRASEAQRLLASQPAIKIHVKEEGWYRVTQPDLVAAGLDSGIIPGYLQLFVDGKEQPMYVIGGEDASFDAPDYIEFYGTGIDTPSTDTRVYWVVVGSRPGKRIQVSGAQGGRTGASSFRYTVERKDRTIYFAALKNGETDNFFGPVISTTPLDQILNISHPDPLLPGNALLEIALQGVTTVPHRVKVLFNEVDLGELIFNGRSHKSARWALEQSLLLEGENLVTLVAQEGETDMSLVDDIRLTYWRTNTAEEDMLRLTARVRQQVTIDGFTKSQIRVMDITNPDSIRELEGVMEQNGVSYSVRVSAPASGTRTLLAFTEDMARGPVSITANQTSAWSQFREGADLVIISHRDFIESLRTLKTLREEEGWSVVIADVEDIYDEFSFGQKNSWAIRNFLLRAKTYWRKKPRFVLLVGDASFDPRNYLDLGDFDFVPTKIVETDAMETASDDWFADFNGDGIPEMALGRLPVRTVEEASLVVSKIVGYGQGAGGVMKDVVLVADENEGYDFEAVIHRLGDLFPPDMEVMEILRGQGGDPKSDLLSRLNQGPLLVNYFGHGSEEIWRGSLLTSDDAGLLTNGSRLSFFANVTCLNGIFHDIYAESLAEALLKAQHGGAVAVWASSGLCEADGQARLNQRLIRLLFNEKELTLGEATVKAKASVHDMDIRRTYILFGDPTTRLKY